MNKDFEIIIVGGGPAGISTWLFLQKHAPHLAAKTLVIEKSTYPRKKLCGGGISTPGRDLLLALDFKFDFDYMPIRFLKVNIGYQNHTIPAPPGFAVVDRSTFDHAMAKEAIKRGLILHQNESYIGFERSEDALIVETNITKYQVKAMVGADGANSRVRKSLGLSEPPRLCRLLETYACNGYENDQASEFQTATFDFSSINNNGLQGYTWKFPCFHNGKMGYNAGIYDSQTYPDKKRTRIKEILSDKLEEGSTVFDDTFQSHPIRYFSPEATFSVNNIMLAGDSAGVEPALGEGISTSIAYGQIVAAALNEGFQNKDYSFSNYKLKLLQSRLGQNLQQQVKWAQSFYKNDGETATSLKRYFLSD